MRKFLVRTVFATLGIALAAPSFAQTPKMLPDRLLQCTIGRMTNVDTKKEQTKADIIFEGSHRFDLFLPGIPARTAPPPDAIEPPEPVDPRTQVRADPDGLRAGVPEGFTRVVDYWPDRVELVTAMTDPLVHLIVIHPIDAAAKAANIFMTFATDLATYDMKRVYSGDCTIVE